MNKMEYYTVYYIAQGQMTECYQHFPNEESAKEWVKNKKPKSSTIEKKTTNDFLSFTVTNNPYGSIDSGFIKLGDLKSIRGSYECTAFVTAEFRERGTNAFLKEIDRRNKDMDNYYSRPWV